MLAIIRFISFFSWKSFCFDADLFPIFKKNDNQQKIFKLIYSFINGWQKTLILSNTLIITCSGLTKSKSSLSFEVIELVAKT